MTATAPPRRRPGAARLRVVVPTLRVVGWVATRVATAAAEELAAVPKRVWNWQAARRTEQWKRRARREQIARRDAARQAWFAARCDELTDPLLTPEQLARLVDEAVRRADTPLALRPMPSRYGPVSGPAAVPANAADAHELFRMVLAHPNTDPELLLSLARRHRTADALLRNPVLPLLPLSSPDFFSQLPEEACWRLLAAPDCPPSVVAVLTTDARPVVADAARNHVVRATDRDGALPSLADLPATERNFHRQVRERLSRLLADDTPRIRALVVEMHALGVLPESFWDIAAAVRGGPSQTGGLSQTGRRNDADDPLDAMPLDASTQARIADASDPATHLWTLRMLAADPHPAVRRAACAHPRAPIDVREYARATALREAATSAPLCLLLHLAASAGRRNDTLSLPLPTELPTPDAAMSLGPLRRLLCARTAHPAEDRDLLAVLAHDSDRHVRWYAAHRMKH